MATTTTRLGLSKPATTDLVDIAVLNGNFDKTDAAAGAYVCTSTTRPSTPYSGQIIYETDTSRSLIWNSATSTWLTLVPGSTVCTSSSRPSSPVPGQVIYETDTKLTYVYASGAWAPVLNDKGLSAFSPIKVASSAARDALFTSPAQGDRVFRTDLQVEEIYFAVYNASTNVSGAKTAGWFPAPNSAIFMGTASRSAAGSTVYTVGSTGFSYTELSDIFTWHDATTNPERITPTKEGLYRVTASVQYGAGTVNNRTISITKNGTNISVGAVIAGNSTAPSASATVFMNGTTDYFTVTIYQSDTATLTASVQFMVEYSRPSIV